MAIRSENNAGSETRDECAIRIAATGDIHLGRDGDQERWAAAFEGLRDRVDLVLLAGDLTTHGEPEQAAMVGHAVQDLDVPILCVLGNHDWFSVSLIPETLERTTLGNAAPGSPVNLEVDVVAKYVEKLVAR